MQVFLGKGADVHCASILMCKLFSFTFVGGMYFPQNDGNNDFDLMVLQNCATCQSVESVFLNLNSGICITESYKTNVTQMISEGNS